MSDYIIYEDLKLIYYRPEGIISTAAIQSFIDELVNDSAYRENMFEYIDLSRVSQWDIKLEELRAIFNKEISKQGKRKVIDKMSIWAPSDISFGISRMFHSVASFHSMQISISRDEEKALQFLDIKKSDLNQPASVDSPAVKNNNIKITPDK